MLSIIWLKSPYFLTSLIEITPPTQSDKQSSCDILDNPEIDGTQYSDDNEGGDETEDIAEEKVTMIELQLLHYECCGLKQESKYATKGVSSCR